MNTPLSHRMSTEYPDWHKQPFRLSVEEIENPHLVFEEFFTCYNLVNVRDWLWNWLHDAMHIHQLRGTDLLYFYEHIEKLIEAAWVLHCENKKERIGKSDDK